MAVSFSDYVLHAMRHLTLCDKMAYIIPWFLLLLIVVDLTGCGDKEHKTDVPPRPVRFVIAPQPSSSSLFIQTGEIRAHEDVTLGFRLDGRLLSRSVDVGDHVEAGQVLAAQESDTSRNQLNTAQADLNSALAAEQRASLNLKRMKLLMPQGAIARAELDTALADWQAAVSRRQGCEDALKNARDHLAWSRLTAPVSGVITQVSASPGEVVNAGQSIVTLASGSGRDAVFDVAQPQAVSRNPDAYFTVSLLSDSSVVTRGYLRDISPQADPQTRTWRVRVTLNNPPTALALGAIVQAELQQSGQSMIAIPASAMTRSGGKPAIFIVDRKSSRLHLRTVVLGRYATAEIFITDGLKPGETVVTAGVSKLREGESVTLGEDSK